MYILSGKTIRTDGIVWELPTAELAYLLWDYLVWKVQYGA